MSLEQQIAVLANEAAALNQTFQNKKAEIDAAVAAAVAAAPNLYRAMYVDAIAGDDGNDGLSANTTLASIKAAIDRCPEGGRATIYLTNASSVVYAIDQDIVVYNKHIQIVGDNNAPANFVIRPTAYISSGSNRTKKIRCYSGSSVILFGVRVVLPQPADPNLQISSNDYVAVQTSGYQHSGNCRMALVNSDADVSVGGTLFSCKGGNAFVMNATSNVTTGGVGFVFHANNYVAGYEVFGGTIDNAAQHVTGIVRDAAGYPRNVISNIVL